MKISDFLQEKYHEQMHTDIMFNHICEVLLRNPNVEIENIIKLFSELCKMIEKQDKRINEYVIRYGMLDNSK